MTKLKTKIAHPRQHSAMPTKSVATVRYSPLYPLVNVVSDLVSVIVVDDDVDLVVPLNLHC